MTYATFLENFIDCPCAYFGLWLGALFGIPVVMVALAHFFTTWGLTKWKTSSKD